MAQGTRYQVFKDRAGKFWWRLRAANEYIVANSAEGYERKDHAVAMVEWMRQNGGNASYEDLT
jgi:uncharacterized protein YegP (UPF0339 family)